MPSRLEGMETHCFGINKDDGGMSTCAFPFGGNGNPRSRTTIHGRTWCLHVPSRLEGMETYLNIHQRFRLADSSLHVPSRLEGMETLHTPILTIAASLVSTCAFPFGGNGNSSPPIVTSSFFHCLHVPSRLEGMETLW